MPADGCVRGTGSAVTVRTVARPRPRPRARSTRLRPQACLADGNRLSRHDGPERSPAPCRDRSRALSLGRPRHPRHDRRGADARPRGVRPLRDGDRAGRSRADAPRPHRRGEPHEVRLPLRGRRGLGPPPPALPARARAEAPRRCPGERHPPAPRPRRGQPLRRRGPRRADGRGRRAAAARGAGERQRERPAPPRPLRPPRVAALRDDGDPARRDPHRGVVRRDGGARRHGRGSAGRDRDRGDGGRRRAPPLPARREPARSARTAARSSRSSCSRASRPASSPCARR